MKQSKQIVDKRRQEILHQVIEKGSIRVEDMVRNLNVSSLTIRRDFQYLEDQGLIERFHGGAKIIEKKTTKEDELLKERNRIAKYAATLVNDGDILFINTSRTALSIIRYITAKAVTVITNNGNAINEPHSPEVTVILTGGELRYVKGTMVGEFALDSVNKSWATKTFLGCSGLSSKVGMTTDILNEVKINEAMFNRSHVKSYILADHTKIGKICSFVSCPISMITDVITDQKADEKEINQLTKQNIQVIKVP